MGGASGVLERRMSSQRSQSSLDSGESSEVRPTSTLIHGNDRLLTLTDMANFCDLEVNLTSAPSRTSETPPFILRLLHLVTDNLLSEEQAVEMFPLVSQGSNRKLFKSLVANISPTTKAIAQSFLPAAIQSVDVAMVKTLLATGVTSNRLVGADMLSQFVTAIGSRSVAFVQHFLDHGADADVSTYGRGYTYLEAAAQTGQIDLAKPLLPAG